MFTTLLKRLSEFTLFSPFSTVVIKVISLCLYSLNIKREKKKLNTDPVTQINSFNYLNHIKQSIHFTANSLFTLIQILGTAMTNVNKIKHVFNQPISFFIHISSNT